MGNCVYCKRFIVSEDVTFAAGVLTINLPAGSYNDGQKYCILLNQPIPAEATIGAQVVITIGDGTVQYPVVTKCGVSITAPALRSRTLYPMCVATTATGGTFRILGKTCCAPGDRLAAIDGTDAAAAGGGDGA